MSIKMDEAPGTPHQFRRSAAEVGGTIAAMHWWLQASFPQLTSNTFFSFRHFFNKNVNHNRQIPKLTRSATAGSAQWQLQLRIGSQTSFQATSIALLVENSSIALFCTRTLNCVARKEPGSPNPPQYQLRPSLSCCWCYLIVEIMREAIECKHVYYTLCNS